MSALTNIFRMIKTSMCRVYKKENGHCVSWNEDLNDFSWQKKRNEGVVDLNRHPLGNVSTNLGWPTATRQDALERAYRNKAYHQLQSTDILCK